MRDVAPADHRTEIAIIGMAGRFPGARDIDQLWQKICRGEELITQFSDDELLAAGVTEEALADPYYVKAGAVIDGIELFDASFFGYTPKEAQVTDPQQRLFLEAAWNALEDAGYDPSRFGGSIGVFAGSALSTYLLNNLAAHPELSKTVGHIPLALGNDKDSLSTRVAYALDLTGPCYSIQSYCSTSLVAVCAACTSLLSGECDLALAGGVAVSVPQRVGYFYQEGGMASPDGRCRAFDAMAQGAPLGNGVGIVVLKRMEDALEADDSIYAVIKGWAVNNDGSVKVGYTAPGVRGQAGVIAEALANADVDADSIDCIEAHGTGTALGDAAEFAALIKSFREHTDRVSFCAIGSVKTNVGHLDRAAGVTGLIKTALALRHKTIPPSLNFTSPNPEIDFTTSPFFVNTRLAEWTDKGHPRRAGVSAFGIGGTNAHIILEEPPEGEPQPPARPATLLLASARSVKAVESQLANIADYLRKNDTVDLADVAFTLQVGRKEFACRRALVGDGREDVLAALEQRDPGRILESTLLVPNRPVAFLFGGVGEHYSGMGSSLYAGEQIFRDTVNQCSALLANVLKKNIADVLYSDQCAPIGKEFDLRRMLGRDRQQTTGDQLTRTAIAQPAVFVVEYALAQLLMSWGIQPQAMIGYSLGEYVAACVAGVLSLEDALYLVAERARLIEQQPAGAMLAVSLSPAALRPLLGSELDVAAINGITMSVVAGPPAAVAELERGLQARQIACRLLATSHAFHSRMLAPIGDRLTEWIAAKIRLHPPRIPYISNVTGTWITDEEATDPAYWARHMCQPVQLFDGLSQLLDEPDRLLLEIGPGQSLGAFVKQHPGCSSERFHLVLPTLRYAYDPHDDLTFLLTTLGKLWLTGVCIDWAGYYANERRRRISLPSYPFERQRYWVEPPRKRESVTKEASVSRHGKQPIDQWLYVPVWRQQHVVDEGTEFATPCLVFADDHGLGDQLCAALRERSVSCVRVVPGDEFAATGATSFTIRPANFADYTALLGQLAEREQLPRTVVHLWSVGGGPQRADDRSLWSRSQSLGFYSLSYLARALGRITTSAVRVAVVTDHVQPVSGQEPLVPEKATVLGPCTVIAQEYPDLACRSIDLVLTETNGAAGRDMVARLVEELRWPGSDTVIAHRDGSRWVQDFEPVAPQGGTSEPMLRARGVYLITGGLGKVGMALAEHLGRTVQAKLVLIGRSALPPRREWPSRLRDDPDGELSHRIRSVMAIEATGAEVLVLAADVSDEERMRSVVRHAHERFGPINGVVHAAGVTGVETFQAIHHLDPEICEAHFLPKAHGTIVLERVLRDEPLDFCMLQSSLSTVLGGLGFASYAAANHFMDACAHRFSRCGAARWMSIDWDTWQSTMQKLDGNRLGATMAHYAMTPEEGVATFERVLACSAPRIVVSTGDLQTRIGQWIKPDRLSVTEASGESSALEFFPRPQLPQAYAPAKTEYERRLAHLWQDVLGIDQIGVNDNFFDLGGDSLIGMQLINRLKKELNIPLPAVALFEAPTISAFASYLMPTADQAEDTRTGQLEQRRVRVRQRAEHDSIAIIGMAGRFPGARNVAALWRNLCGGVESIDFFTEAELIASGVPVELVREPNYVKARPVLDDIASFDASFFGYSPREAELTDPQHRIFLECAWEALETAGYAAPSYQGLIGVFGGTNISTYLLGLYGDLASTKSVNEYQAVIGNDKDALTTIISYKFNLKGPSMAVQTFCSTSLVAVHLACQSLLGGECDVALAGGVSVRVPDRVGHLYVEGGMESPDGHVRTFDARAHGGMFGDGAGVVVLKRLHDAQQDRDTICAVIKGSAVNNDGSLKPGYTAPSVIGQAEVVARALANAGVSAETISYVEAHGTATELGDPIEVTSLTRAFGHVPRKQYCAIGSVKTNIGHLDRAAGATGLIKTVLALQYRQLPPSLHFETPNPEIDFEHSPFYVNTTLADWTTNGAPRRAGVNSLGMGGTNAHVVLEEAPAPEPTSPSRSQQLLVLSARTPTALDAATAQLAEHLRRNPQISLPDVAFSLQVGRKEFEYRRALLGTDLKDILTVLDGYDQSRLLSSSVMIADRPVAFVFGGVGEHYAGMGAELYTQERLFREVVDECSGLLAGVLGLQISELLSRGEDTVAGQLTQTEIAQPAVFVVEYAVARLLMSWGIRPQAMIGYSLGEYVAACVAGVLSLKDALRLVAERARLIQELPAGAMLAMSLSPDALRPLLDGELDVAAVNGVSASVVAGPPQAVAQLEEQLHARGVACRHLVTSHAFHSRMMVPISDQLTEWIATKVRLHPPQISYISNVTGTWISAEEATDPAYWARHLCQPVRFADGLGHLLDEPDRLLLEIAPGQALGAFATQHPSCPTERFGLVLPTLRSAWDPRDDVAFLLTTVAKLWLAGVRIDWTGYFANERRRRIPLPTYPFQRQCYWIEPSLRMPAQVADSDLASADPGAALMRLPRQDVPNWLYLPAWRQSVPPSLEHLAPSDKIAVWLVLADEYGIGEQLARKLEERDARVTLVKPGSEFARMADGFFVVDPRRRDHYVALLDALRDQRTEPNHILHLWTLDKKSAELRDAEFEQELDLGFFSLMRLTQAIGDAALEACHIVVVTSDTQNVIGCETVRPEKATIVGPCRVIPLECSQISCRSIDVVVPEADGAEESALIEQLFAELYGASADSLIALRGRRRWVPAYEPLPETCHDTTTLATLRNEGIYLITGGLGGIGLAIAKGLARTVKAKLVLVSRTALPLRGDWPAVLAAADAEQGVCRRIRQVQELEAAGSEVLVIAADVSSQAQMEAAIAEALGRFGRIDGLIHVAGVPGMGLLQFKTPEMVAQVLAPKMVGALVLERCLQDVPLDFFALFSSITSITGGGPGQADYCAANAFLDAFAQRHASGQRRVIAINWGEWQWNAWDMGMAGYGSDLQSFFRQSRQKFGIHFAEGWEAFTRALASGLPQVIVSTQDFRSIVELSDRFTAATLLNRSRQSERSGQRHARPSLATSYVAPSTDLEQMIAETWAEMLGLEEVGILDNFFELGGNSLLGVDLVARLRKELDNETIPPHVLYEASTVRAVARFVTSSEQLAGAKERRERGEKRRRSMKRVRDKCEKKITSPQ